MSSEIGNQHKYKHNNNNNSVPTNPSSNHKRISALLVSTATTTAPQTLPCNSASSYSPPLDAHSIETYSPPRTAHPIATPIHTHQVNKIYAKAVGGSTSTQMTPNPTAAAALLSPHTDIIGSVLGDFGVWQLRSVLILFLCKLPASWFMACIIFTAPELKAPTEYRCDATTLNANKSITPNQCYVLEWSAAVLSNGTTATTPLSKEPCTRFVYNFDFHSLIMQFNLVCLRDIFVAWTQYWHLFGILVGGILGTKAMSRLSPRTVYVIGAVLQILVGIVTGYAQDFTVHCAFRCLSAVCCALMFTSAQAIFVDITGNHFRTGIVILYDTFWSLGLILLPGIATFFNNWSHLYLGITFPTIVLLLLRQWTPDSPRWLLRNGIERDIYRVERMIRKAANINERTFLIPIDFRQQLEGLRKELRTQNPTATWLQLWSGSDAKRYMVAAHMALACYIVNFMGMLLNIRSFGRDYLVANTIAMGFAEIIGCFLALHFTMKQDRQKFLYAGVFNIIAGCFGCLCWTFTSVNLKADPKVTLWMILALVPKASVSCALSMLQACMAEIMPPRKKRPFVFSVVTWSRIWLLSAPFINVLKKTDVALSLTVFSLLTVLGGICTCLLQPPNKNNKTNLSRNYIVGDEDLTKEKVSLRAGTVWSEEEDPYSTHL